MLFEERESKQLVWSLVASALMEISADLCFRAWVSWPPPAGQHGQGGILLSKLPKPKLFSWMGSHSWGLLTKKKAPLALEIRYFQRSTHSEETLWRLLCACGQSQQQLTEMRARAAGGAAAGPRMVGSLRLQGLGPFYEAACHHWPHHLRMSCWHSPLLLPGGGCTQSPGDEAHLWFFLCCIFFFLSLSWKLKSVCGAFSIKCCWMET